MPMIARRSSPKCRGAVAFAALLFSYRRHYRAARSTCGQDGHLTASVYQERATMRARNSASPAWQTAIVVLCRHGCRRCGIGLALLGTGGLRAGGLGLVFDLRAVAIGKHTSALGVGPDAFGAPARRGVALAIGIAAWIVGAQARTMATEMPNYAENIRGRIRSLRSDWPGPIEPRPGDHGPRDKR